MTWFTTTLRRSLWLVLIAAAGGAVWAWRRDAADAANPAPAEWPPLPTPAAPAAAVPAPAAEPADAASGGAASIVNALVDAPEARSSNATSGGWADPLPDGSGPDGYPIKANDNSGIFHVPGGRFYDRTKAERYYSDAAAAMADGYRQAKN